MQFKHFRNDNTGAISIISDFCPLLSCSGRTAIKYGVAYQNPKDQFNKAEVNSLLRGRIEEPDYVFINRGEDVSHHVIMGKILAQVYARGLYPTSKVEMLRNELGHLCIWC